MPIDDKKYALGKSISNAVMITALKLRRFGAVWDASEAVELLKPLVDNLAPEAKEAWDYHDEIEYTELEITQNEENGNED